MDKKIDIEAEMKACARRLGAIVADDTPGAAKHPNADFWFAKDHVVAELKCLSENWFERSSYNEWLQGRYVEWVRRGLAKPVRTRSAVVNLADLPRACYLEVLELVRKRMEGYLKTASKQIQATRRAVDDPQARGLLLLANDGNFGIVPGMVRDVLVSSLPKYSGINTVLHFVANMPSELPGIDKDILYWCQWSRAGIRRPVAGEFLDRLKDEWFATLERAMQESIPSLGNEDFDVAELKFI